MASFDKSISYSKTCIDLRNKKKGDQTINDVEMFSLVCLGKAYFGVSDFHSSLKYFDEALIKSDQENNTCVKFLVYESLGILFCKLCDFDTSLSYLERCFDIVHSNQDELLKYKRRVQVDLALPLLHSNRLNDAMEMCEVRTGT